MEGQREAVAAKSLRILHVDDEPDIREIVELSLSLDPTFAVRSCATGSEALATANDWMPDIILCDVMMPVMDGPATLARLRESPETADTPVVFMTARAQTREIERFKSLGAAGVIAKPFDPTTLAAMVQNYLQSAKFNKLNHNFARRLRGNATVLTAYREMLRSGANISETVQLIEACAHKLHGAAAVFGLQRISCAAAALEESAIACGSKRNLLPNVERHLNALIDCVESELGNIELEPVHDGRTPS